MDTKGVVYKIFLIIAGWIFYLVCSPASILYLIAVTVVSYILGLVMGRLMDNDRFICVRIVLLISILSLVSLLIYFKYMIIRPDTSFTVPLGLSYYSLMVIGYLTDIYRKDIHVQKDLLSYALYVGFFAQISAGPIGRSKKLFPQYEGRIKVTGEKVRYGLVMIIYGIMQKFIVADNLRSVANAAFGGDGEALSVVMGMMLYSLVIYYDFAGYSMIAIGIGRVFGIELSENFKRPYMATDIKDFWRRWHISLSSWFRDYVYIPLGGSKSGEAIRDISTLIVFELSGMWHGMQMGFWLWGLMHGIYLVCENHLRSMKKRIRKDLQDTVFKRMIKRIIVFLLVSFAWIPFYAGDLKRTVSLYKSLLSPDVGMFLSRLSDDFGILRYGFIIVLICLVISILINIYNEISDNDFYEMISRNDILTLISAICVFVMVIPVGVYGSGYDASVFIYGGF